ncbi:hypothetical protein JAAARDRAFT_193485 [Jaapia argillacea MUCL 33604]|uniref:Cytochrome P450 n=1 Tax=Jaapia argillacea MUCL 33604 TaxID=933084 RepID=A0A067PVW0_9AGAM|nr:hypothetical protein JAAARDRAFT_193485 [Jaapia argillacea MUCL 33604]
MSTAETSLSLAFLLAVVFLISLGWRSRERRTLPPGPGPNEVLTDLPKENGYRAFDKWIKKYGPIISYRTGGTPVIGTYPTPTTYSMAMKCLYESGQHIGMSGRASLAYKPFQTLESSIFLRDLIRDADGWIGYLERFASSVVFAISYGQRIKTLDDEMVAKNREILKGIMRFAKQGNYLVESYPILLKLPVSVRWFLKEPTLQRQADTATLVNLLNNVRTKMKEGRAKESMSTRILSGEGVSEKNRMTEEAMAYAASAPFTAGVDSSTAAMQVFFLAMLHYPDVAKKAQEELDRVVGRDRMPEFRDEESLPFMRALIKENLRWRPIAPTGIPHAVIQDDVYNGYFIPKGSTVFADIFTMAQDPDMFPNPEAFEPERFLKTTDPRLLDFTLPFGFGRRICPGMHVASQSLFILITRILWAFEIKPLLDGSLPDSDAFVANSLTRAPKPFRFVLEPRDGDVLKLIGSYADEADVLLREWED